MRKNGRESTPSRRVASAWRLLSLLFLAVAAALTTLATAGASTRAGSSMA